MSGAGEALQLGGERGRGERAGGEDGDGVGVVLVELRDFFAMDGDARLGGDAVGDAAGEFDAVDGESVAGGNGGGVRLGSRTEPARRISCFSSQGAVFSDSDLSELEQTSSAKSAVWWASVERVGRIS